MSAPSYQLPDAETAHLHSLGVPDVLPALSEPVFEEYVALTARIFSLPISLISVGGEHTAYYPVNYGMPGNNQSPYIEALCATALAQARTTSYCDLEQETSAAIAPEARQAARRNGVGFYAGALLYLPSQRPFGTLSIMDRQARPFTADEQHILELLATLVSQTIVVHHRCLAHPESDTLLWGRYSTELLEEVQALNALVRYLSARYGTMVPIPAVFLTQVESRIHDLQELLDGYCS